MADSSRRPVEDMNVHIGGKKYFFRPAQARARDMPYLLHLFVALLGMRTAGEFAVDVFVADHDLWHCFEPAGA